MSIYLSLSLSLIPSPVLILSLFPPFVVPSSPGPGAAPPRPSSSPCASTGRSQCTCAQAPEEDQRGNPNMFLRGQEWFQRLTDTSSFETQPSGMHARDARWRACGVSRSTEAVVGTSTNIRHFSLFTCVRTVQDQSTNPSTSPRWLLFSSHENSPPVPCLKRGLLPPHPRQKTPQKKRPNLHHPSQRAAIAPAAHVLLVPRQGHLHLHDVRQHHDSLPSPPPVRSGHHHHVQGDQTYKLSRCYVVTL